MNYRTKEGDVLDAICARYYGNTPFDLAKVISANPGLSAYGPVLPSGLIVILPDMAEAPAIRPALRLWS